MTVREARCACGALKARAEGDPVRLSICHCLDCKRRTGSAFGWNATYAAGQVAVEGPSKAFTRGSDDGFWVPPPFLPRMRRHDLVRDRAPPGHGLDPRRRLRRPRLSRRPRSRSTRSAAAPGCPA